MACGILVPGQKMEPVPAAMEAWIPNHWTTTEVLPSFFFFIFIFIF